MLKMSGAVLVAAMLALPAGVATAQVNVSPADSIESVLKAQKGNVTVRLRSGQEMTGAVRAVTGKLLHLGAISGREFFDAVIPLESIDAVLIRTKQ